MNHTSGRYVNAALRPKKKSAPYWSERVLGAANTSGRSVHKNAASTSQRAMLHSSSQVMRPSIAAIATKYAIRSARVLPVSMVVVSASVIDGRRREAYTGIASRLGTEIVTTA